MTKKIWKEGQTKTKIAQKRKALRLCTSQIPFVSGNPAVFLSAIGVHFIIAPLMEIPEHE
jgi:hypothetical protein